jgi:hypothetical protein
VLKSKGLTDERDQKVEKALPGVFDVEQALAPWVLGTEALRAPGRPRRYNAPGFNLLRTGASRPRSRSRSTTTSSVA